MVAVPPYRQVPVQNQHKHVLITGASAGIGKALAQQLSKTAQISALARRADKLKELCAQHENISGYSADVADRQAVSAQIKKAISAKGSIDIAILNAGMYQPVAADKIDADVFQKHMDINYMGIIHCLETLVPQMLKAGAGHIVLMASVAGYRGLPQSAAYGPTKAAIQNLAECLYFDLKPKNITIQLVNPGFVKTDATAVNDFTMPGLISAEQAAQEIISGISRKNFEIAFPRKFARFMKCASILPYDTYLRLAAKFTNR